MSVCGESLHVWGEARDVARGFPSLWTFTAIVQSGPSCSTSALSDLFANHPWDTIIQLFTCPLHEMSTTPPVASLFVPSSFQPLVDTNVMFQLNGANYKAVQFHMVEA